MELELTDEQQMVLKTAADFARAEVLPKAAEIDREHRHPKELVARMGELPQQPQHTSLTPMPSRAWRPVVVVSRTPWPTRPTSATSPSISPRASGVLRSTPWFPEGNTQPC